MGLLNFTYDDAKKFAPRRSDRVLPEHALNVRGLLDAATMVPVAGDALSGLLAVNDAAKGDYGSAAMNALGLLPFVSAAPLSAMKAIDKAAQMKGVTTKAGRLAKAMPGQAGAIVYHGSPHKFDKFDMSKIGTGEGAQAYGHGLYMAEAPETAQMYRASVAAEKGKSFGLEDGPIKGIATLIAARGAKGEEMARKAYAGQVPDIEQAIKSAKDAVNGNSQLYKVDIPDEAVARFLDWDKPLSQQAPEVQTAIKNSGIKINEIQETGDDALKSFFGGEEYAPHGESLYRFLGNKEVAANRLREIGIPGIRYLDGVSRGQQAGTSNFVLFDDQMPRILEVNGNQTGLQPWAKGEWNGLLGL